MEWERGGEGEGWRGRRMKRERGGEVEGWRGGGVERWRGGEVIASPTGLAHKPFTRRSEPWNL